MERTEEQKILHAPIAVILGGKSYDLPPLTIKESRIWRGKLFECLQKLPKSFDTSNPESVETNLSMIFLTAPEMIGDLFFSYAVNLNREEIEAVATDTELQAAFEKVVEDARPLELTKGLAAALQKLAQ